MGESPSNDPLGFIGQNRNTSLSQEEEILECPLARQSQPFPDSDTQSQWMTSSPPFQIIMESPPDSDPFHDDDKFLTPPEHHFPNPSDSDNLKSPPHSSVAATTVLLGCDCVIKDHPVEVLGTGFHENRVTEKMDLGVGVDCVNSSQETENVAGSDFGENGVSGEEIVSKEVSEKLELGGGVDCATRSQETENVDKEISDLNSEETVVLCGNDEMKGVDEVKVRSRVDLGRDKVFGTGGDLGFGMEGDLDDEQCDYIVRDIVTKVGCEEELKLGVLGVGNGCVGKMEHSENTDTDITLEPEDHAEEIKLSNENLVTQLDLAEKGTNEGDEVIKRKLLDKNVGDDRGLYGLSRGENELVDGEVRGRVNASEYCQDINGIENGGNKEDVKLGRTGKRKRQGGKRKLQGTDKTNTGKSKEDIEKFKYVKASDGAGQRGRDENGRVDDETVSGEGNVPLAKTSECPLSEGGQGSVKNENIRFMNFLNKAADLLKREVDSDTEVDLMETLKKKGVKFPRPSWWPPEGFH